ncbi:MAG: nicotinate-nicotinamide nucleotide adenylyltransferase [Leptospirales bacterium]|nr:nicotinate-nicotinamide nucleotide adenylyltransferase [Leptospirales bacterium]
MFDRVVFGGSFDPPHAGHEQMARFALERTRHLSFLPANASPFKGSSHASFQNRMEMISIIAAKITAHLKEKKVDVLDLEGLRAPPSYTFETMRTLRAKFPGESIALILGSDSVATFDQWREPAEILRHHPLLVFIRTGDSGWPGSAESLITRFSARIETEDRTIPQCASRQIRSAISSSPADTMIHECLDKGVLSFIKARGIYSNV